MAKNRPIEGVDGTLVQLFARCSSAAGDSRQGQWSRRQLQRMDERFVAAMQVERKAVRKTNDDH